MSRNLVSKPVNHISKRIATPKPVPAGRDTEWKSKNTPTLFVQEELCAFAADCSAGTIVIENENTDGNAIPELQSVDARNLALAYASAAGVGDARINGNIIGPYPVNEDGYMLDEVAKKMGQESLPATHPKMQPAFYRCDVPIRRKF